MPLKGAYTVDELAQRCAKAEIEIERLRAALKKIGEDAGNNIYLHGEATHRFVNEVLAVNEQKTEGDR